MLARTEERTQDNSGAVKHCSAVNHKCRTLTITQQLLHSRCNFSKSEHYYLVSVELPYQVLRTQKNQSISQLIVEIIEALISSAGVIRTFLNQ